MDIQVNTNKLINEIMSNANSAIMLFAPNGTGKAAFISELGNRYQKVFWFSSSCDCMEAFALTLAFKIVEDEELLLRIKQLSYCESEYNNDRIIINATLDYISSLKGNFLLVLEHLDGVSEGFDLSLVERLIKHCPRNLKILISAQEFINFDYSKFEPLYPILIDENVMGKRAKTHDFEESIRDLSDEQRAFLSYIAPLHCVDTQFADEFFPQCKELLEYLCRKTWYIVRRGNDKYFINLLLKDYLGVEKGSSQEYYNEFAKQNVFKRYADYLFDRELFAAFKMYLKAEDIKMVELCIAIGIKDETFAQRLDLYAKHIKKVLYQDAKSYPYFQLYLAFVSFHLGNYTTAFDNLNSLLNTFQDQPKALYYCYKLMVKSLCAQKDFKRAYDFIVSLKDKYTETDPIIGGVLCLTPQIYRELDIAVDFNFLKSIEEDWTTVENAKQIWYPKVLQVISETYFDAGNYKKAVQILNKIKEVIPFYVIPHNIVMFYYYSGNIESAHKMAVEALEFAQRNEITKDVSYIYTALANFDLYSGNIKEALKKFDTAVSLDKTNSATKFFNIALRSMAYARYDDINYAREITHIYLKYCETYYPQYANMLLCAMAFCYYKLNAPEQAYFYATQCIKTSKARSIFWLIGMAIATTHLLNSNELKDAQKLIRNIIKSSYVYGMEIMLVDNIDIFEPLFDYAIRNNIEIEYIENIYQAVNKKKSQKKKFGNLKIKLFGNTSVLFKDEEVAWKTRKAKELFFHYVLAGDKGIDRNVIINYLWKDYLYESAINNLKTTNNIIRKTLTQLNVDFKLEYMNTKYILTLKDIHIDYTDYAKLAAQYKKETNIKKRIELMNAILDIYKDDFAIDMDKTDFNNARQSIKQELMIKLLKLSRELSQEGDYIEAKKFIQALATIDRNTDYTQKIAEIDSYITL